MNTSRNIAPLLSKPSLGRCLPSLLGIAILGLLTPAAHAQTNLVLNPGFETGSFADWTTTYAPAGSDLGTTVYNPHSGTYAAEFGAFGGTDDSLSQSISTTAGDEYAVSFWLLNNGGPGNEFHADFGGDTLLELQGAPQFGYTEYSSTVLATSASTALTFAGRTPDGNIYLDDTSVKDLGAAPVPEASTTVSFGLLLVLGLGGLIVAAKRKKTSVV